MRCFHEMGVSDLILDMRLLGNPKEIWQCVTEAAKVGVKAVSIHAMAGVSNIQLAIQAAEASKFITKKIARPKILVSLLPSCLGHGELVDELHMRVKRSGHVTQSARNLISAGADGMIVEFDDMPHVRRASKRIPLLVFAEKRPGNHHELENKDDEHKVGIAELLEADADHVILDSNFVANTDTEWAADLINKELAPFQPAKESK